MLTYEKKYIELKNKYKTYQPIEVNNKIYYIPYQEKINLKGYKDNLDKRKYAQTEIEMLYRDMDNLYNKIEDYDVIEIKYLYETKPSNIIQIKNIEKYNDFRRNDYKIRFNTKRT